MKLRRLLTSDSLGVRVGTLWLTGIGLNLLAWWVGHTLLPNAALDGLFPLPDLVSQEAPPGSVALRIVLYNLVVAGGLIAAANLFRVDWFPLGYLPVLFHWTGYGLFLGTNSFAVARVRPTRPSLVRLVTSAGFVELTAYTLLGAATVGLWVFRQESWTRWATRRERRWRDIRLGRYELATVAAAVGLIVQGAVREAGSILSVLG